MNITSEHTQLLREALLNKNNKVHHAFMHLQQDDLDDVSDDLELTSEQVKALENIGSNFLMIETPAANFHCSSSCWESWYNEDTNFEYPFGLASIWETEEEISENTPFQVCINNKWVGTLPPEAVAFSKHMNIEVK